MILTLIISTAVAAAPDVPAGEDEIVVTATKVNNDAFPSASSPVLATPGLAETVGLPMVTDVLRILPGVSVAAAGPRGSQTQVRLQGAEANHTLLVVDGIRFNDPAAGNEARFELLPMDLLDRITVILGSNSALWGSEAIGGVVTAETRDPASGSRGLGARAEYGSLDSGLASAWVAARTGKVRLSATGAWLSSAGIDAFAPGGERDGFDNRSASAKAVFAPTDSLEFGIVGHAIAGRSEYDGLDPVTFARAETLDETRNRIGAVRGWAQGAHDGWTLKLDSSLLASVNRNLLAGAPLNRTFGRRFTASAQLSKQLGRHLLTAALDHQAERFRARDQVYFGATDQDRSRRLTALVGQWHADWSKALATDFAIRRDRFSAFADATTVRAGVTVKPVADLSLYASYAEGIAQPTFYDLYGFFPGSFAGNPALKPERSTGWQAGANFARGRYDLAVSVFSARLRDEIVDVFDPSTFRSTTANATGTSRRRGLEARAQLRLSPAVHLFLSYTYLDATEQQAAGALLVREVRRPKHSAGFGGDGEIGRLTWGATLAWIGARRDVDFNLFPARTVRLDPYLLASVQLGWRVSKQVEAYARAENAFDARYQDVVGYRMPGRTVYAGLRLRLGD
ncbi:MAG: vitamin transporter [Sphingomonadales bacterium]|jgi:vitamin B12 transporter|nr:vitamin transporter [Sphingomonadales bacterium]